MNWAIAVICVVLPHIDTKSLRQETAVLTFIKYHLLLVGTCVRYRPDYISFPEPSKNYAHTA